MEGASYFLGYRMTKKDWEKDALTWDEQVDLLAERGLAVNDIGTCAEFLAENSYYRFSGYARYFQRAPHEGDDSFLPGTTFQEIRQV